MTKFAFFNQSDHHDQNDPHGQNDQFYQNDLYDQNEFNELCWHSHHLVNFAAIFAFFAEILTFW